MDNSEIIDIGIETLDDYKPSTNFGSGIEMFMNNKSAKNATNSGLETVDDIEHELNALSAGLDVDTDVFGASTSSQFNRGDSFNSFKPEVKFNDVVVENIGLGAATMNTDVNNETWDGFKKFNDIPVNPTLDIPKDPQLSREDVLREKHVYIKKLDYLERKHKVEISKKYTLDSNLSEMKAEYDTIMDDLEKQNSIKFQGKMLMAFVTGVEYLNNKFDPFDVDLEGWGEGVNENITDYDEVFAELHDKYKSKAKMAPEIKLLFMLGGGAVMTHMSNTMFKSAMPGMDDIMRQNPELAQQFTQAAAKTMSEKAPGFSNFMGDVMGANNVFTNQQTPRQHRPHVRTQMTPNRSEMPNRPDIEISRGGNNSSTLMDDDPTIGSNRPEMKGPNDLSDILSGLKTKTININKPTPQSSQIPRSVAPRSAVVPEMALKTKRGRKPSSEKNSLNLDI